MSDREWPEEYSDGNGLLELPSDIVRKITVVAVNNPDDVPKKHQPVHRVTYEPLDITEEYKTASFMSTANPNFLRQAGRRQLVRDHPEILNDHAGESVVEIQGEADE